MARKRRQHASPHSTNNRRRGVANPLWNKLLVGALYHGGKYAALSTAEEAIMRRNKQQRQEASDLREVKRALSEKRRRRRKRDARRAKADK